MYLPNLSTSHFPAQGDAKIRNTTVGGLLREIADKHALSVAMADVSDDGSCGRQWTYGELLEEAERLALALSTRYAQGERIVVWAPNIPQWIFMEYACGLAGMVLVTANPAFQASELKYVLE